MTAELLAFLVVTGISFLLAARIDALMHDLADARQMVGRMRKQAAELCAENDRLRAQAQSARDAALSLAVQLERGDD